MMILLRTIYKIIALVVVLCSCSYFPKKYSKAELPTDWRRIGSLLTKNKISSTVLQKSGPFTVKSYKNFSIPLSPQEHIDTDLFLPTQDSEAPLIIISHGNGFSKFAHRKQAKRLSSWGFPCLLLNLPNRHQWIKNGHSIYSLTKLLNLYPSLIQRKSLNKDIILIGHSFGGSAISIAAGLGAPIKGLILLDPALVKKTVIKHLKKIKVPSVIIGADRKVFRSRKRPLFFKNLAGPKISIDIAGSTHNDAQYPSITTVNWGFDLSTSAKMQEGFLLNIIRSAFSIGATGHISYAWEEAKKDWKNKKISQPKKIRQQADYKKLNKLNNL